MADDSSTTIRATFKTREAADLAVEHLVQQYGSRRQTVTRPVRGRRAATPLMNKALVAMHRSKVRSRSRRILRLIRLPLFNAAWAMPARSVSQAAK